MRILLSSFVTNVFHKLLKDYLKNFIGKNQFSAEFMLPYDYNQLFFILVNILVQSQTESFCIFGLNLLCSDVHRVLLFGLDYKSAHVPGPVFEDLPQHWTQKRVSQFFFLLLQRWNNEKLVRWLEIVCLFWSTVRFRYNFTVRTLPIILPLRVFKVVRWSLFFKFFDFLDGLE